MEFRNINESKHYKGEGKLNIIFEVVGLLHSPIFDRFKDVVFIKEKNYILMKRSCLLMKIITNTSISQRQNPHTWTDQSSYKDIN